MDNLKHALISNRGQDKRLVPAGALIALVMVAVGNYLVLDMVRISQGLDGTIYASLANFMAQGQGGFWSPPHFEATSAIFYDHPPLGLWLQGQWFSLWGDGFWVEKAYSGLLGLGISAAICLLWRGLNEGQMSAAWWPLLIFWAMPVTTFAVKNNTLESLLTLIALVAVIAAWYSLRHRALVFVVALLCFLGCLVKGPAALFLLGVPGCFAVVMRHDWRLALVNSGALMTGFVLLAGALWCYEPAQKFLTQYWQTQVVASLSGQRTVEHGRGELLGWWAYNLSIAAAMSGLCWWYTQQHHGRRSFWALLIIGISAVLPLLISPRHYRHYLLPGMPYFAIAAGLVVGAPRVAIHPKIIWALAGVLGVLMVGRGFVAFGLPGDHKQALVQVESVAQWRAQSPVRGDWVGYCADDLRQRAYLARHFGTRSVVGPQPRADTLVCQQGADVPGYEITETLPHGLVVWRRTAIEWRSSGG